MSNRKGGGFRSMADLQREEQEKRTDKPGQSFYTGGTQSGLAVVDPSQRAGGSAAADSVIARARDDTQQLGTTPVSVALRIELWRQGFTIDGGALHSYEDDEGAAFMRDLERGVVPALLSQTHPDGADVEVIDRRSSDFDGSAVSAGGAAAAASSSSGFQGTGQSLASSSSASAGYAASNLTAVKPVVDAAQPTTSIQVRLADGSRLVVKLNTTHTIADLRRAIDAERPSQQPYALKLQMPRRDLTDLTMTVKDAGLAGAAVLQVV